MATQKQKKALKAVVENGGVVSTAMIEAGYSPNTAHTPQKLTESDGWKELMGKHLSDDYLVEKHRELLDKREKVIIERTQGESPIYEVLDQPETAAVSKGLEMAYKLKGSYAPDKSISVNVQVMDDKAIEDLAIRLNKEMTNEVHKGDGISGNGEIPSIVVEEVRDENGEGDSIRI